MEPIRPQPGSARDPQHFVGRAAATETATRKLRDGTSLLLNDPRRMGKTYWLTFFADRTEDFLPIIIDYEGVNSRDSFLLRTVDALRKSQGLGETFKSRLRALFDNIETGIQAGPLSVKVALQRLPAAKLLEETLTAVAETSPKTVLICMDEVPLAILGVARNEGPASARELLETLRLLRQNQAQIRWILSGSVGFHHVLAECQTTQGDLNDLDNLHLGPLTDAEATELATRLLLGIGAPTTPQIIGRLVEQTGGIPFLLHKIVSLLADSHQEVVIEASVAEAFEEFIDDPDEFRAFSHILTRLEPTYGMNAVLARRILDEAVRADNSLVVVDTICSTLGAPESFDAVVENLISDHYLSRHGSSVRWRYPVLQYIWARRRNLWERP